MERQGAAHSIKTTRPGSASDPARSSRPMSTSEEWKDTGIWTVSQPGFGELHTVASDPEESGEHGLTSWQTPGGYTAQVEQREPVSGGWERQTYQAGPFKTPLRSQVAAESLSRRITQRGVTDPYYTGSSFESYEDTMPEGASMRRRY